MFAFQTTRWLHHQRLHPGAMWEILAAASGVECTRISSGVLVSTSRVH